MPRRIFVLLAVITHCLALCVFAHCIILGPPTGESESSPWDLEITGSAVLGFMILPISYIVILRWRKTRPIAE
jgi:hypothetical protein